MISSCRRPVPPGVSCGLRKSGAKAGDSTDLPGDQIASISASSVSLWKVVNFRRIGDRISHILSMRQTICAECERLTTEFDQALIKNDALLAELDAAVQAGDAGSIGILRRAVEDSLNFCSRSRERIAAHKASPAHPA